MRLIGSLAGVALLLVCHGVASGQEPPPKGESTPPATIQIPAVQQPLAPKDSGEVALRLSAIDSGIAKLTEKASKTDYTPAFLGLLGSFVGVLLGGAITVWSQLKLIAHQRTLAEEAAKLEIGNSLVQWKLKQLLELYGPLHALLSQSNALYRHMNTVLEKRDSNRFRLRQGSPGDDFDKMVFEIKLNGQWVRFRTIMHIGEVYGRNYGIEDYFNEVVAIGGRIVKVIAEKAGYARPEQGDLISVFGKYLAHYSVLERLHSHMKEKYEAFRTGHESLNQMHDAPASAIVVDESAVFPNEIQGLVDKGFEIINSELNAWGAKAAT